VRSLTSRVLPSARSERGPVAVRKRSRWRPGAGGQVVVGGPDQRTVPSATAKESVPSCMNRCHASPGGPGVATFATIPSGGSRNQALRPAAGATVDCGPVRAHHQPCGQQPSVVVRFTPASVTSGHFNCAGSSVRRVLERPEQPVCSRRFRDELQVRFAGLRHRQQACSLSAATLSCQIRMRS